MAKTSAQMAYASPTFKALSDTLHELQEHRRRGRWHAVVSTALRRRRELWEGLALLRRLPTLEVPVTDTPAGAAIVEHLGRGRAVPAGRIARGSLRLPSDPAEYLRGRSKQAVRTNVRHAEQAGISCHTLTRIEEHEQALTEFVAAGGWDEKDRRHLSDVLGVTPGRDDFHVARNAEGRAIAIAATDVDAHSAYLVYLQAADGPLSAPARYALSVHVVNSLIARGVELLLVGNAVRLHPGLQYFQQRLGFEVCNVRVVAAPAAGG